MKDEHKDNENDDDVKKKNSETNRRCKLPTVRHKREEVRRGIGEGNGCFCLLTLSVPLGVWDGLGGRGGKDGVLRISAKDIGGRKGVKKRKWMNKRRGRMAREEVDE